MRTTLWVVAALVGAFVCGILLFNFLIMPNIVQLNQTVLVPRVTGLDLEQAQRICSDRGLTLQVEDRRYSAGVPSDRILSQTPSEGASVKRGRTVRVHVSMGTEMVVVPDVRGMTMRQASLQLDQANLVLGRVSRIHVGTSGQVVRATRPRAGTPAAAGNSVDLLVAVGGAPEPCLMPDLLGRPLDDVRELILERGFRVGRITYRSRRGVYPGTVLEHYPPRGALIHLGESVDLVASTPD